LHIILLRKIFGDDALNPVICASSVEYLCPMTPPVFKPDWRPCWKVVYLAQAVNIYIAPFSWHASHLIWCH